MSLEFLPYPFLFHNYKHFYDCNSCPTFFLLCPTMSTILVLDLSTSSAMFDLGRPRLKNARIGYRAELNSGRTEGYTPRAALALHLFFFFLHLVVLMCNLPSHGVVDQPQRCLRWPSDLPTTVSSPELAGAVAKSINHTQLSSYHLFKSLMFFSGLVFRLWLPIDQLKIILKLIVAW